MSRSHLDVATGGAFFSLNVKDARDLIEKMVVNQGWNHERLQPNKRGMHTVHEVDMLSAKMDLFMKKIEEGSNSKKDQEAIQHYATA